MAPSLFRYGAKTKWHKSATITFAFFSFRVKNVRRVPIGLRHGRKPEQEDSRAARGTETAPARRTRKWRTRRPQPSGHHTGAAPATVGKCYHGDGYATYDACAESSPSTRKRQLCWVLHHAGLFLWKSHSARSAKIQRKTLTKFWFLFIWQFISRPIFNICIIIICMHLQIPCMCSRSTYN